MSVTEVNGCVTFIGSPARTIDHRWFIPLARMTILVSNVLWREKCRMQRFIRLISSDLSVPRTSVSFIRHCSAMGKPTERNLCRWSSRNSVIENGRSIFWKSILKAVNSTCSKNSFKRRRTIGRRRLTFVRFFSKYTFLRERGTSHVCAFIIYSNSFGKTTTSSSTKNRIYSHRQLFLNMPYFVSIVPFFCLHSSLCD